jgi:hypothetical protein
MALTNLNFSLFDVNIQCLMRQEVQLLIESFKNYFFYFFFIFLKTLKNTQLGSYTIPHKLYANVLVIV